MVCFLLLMVIIFYVRFGAQSMQNCSRWYPLAAITFVSPLVCFNASTQNQVDGLDVHQSAASVDDRQHLARRMLPPQISHLSLLRRSLTSVVVKSPLHTESGPKAFRGKGPCLKARANSHSFRGMNPPAPSDSCFLWNQRVDRELYRILRGCRLESLHVRNSRLCRSEEGCSGHHRRAAAAGISRL